MSDTLFGVGTDWTLTANYGLYKPITDADLDMWGEHWNANADTLDNLIFSLNSSMLPLAGGTMTGPLTLAGNATGPLQPVTLQQMNAAVGGYLPLTGGQLTGQLSFLNATVAGVNDFSKHIMLYSGYGLNIGPSTLNVTVGNGAKVQFNVGATSIGYFNTAGLSLLGFGINFGSAFDTANNSAALHLALYSTTYGIGVTSNRLNLIAPGAASLVYVANNQDVFTVTGGAVLTLGYGTQNKLTVTPGAGAGNNVAVALSGTGQLQMPPALFPTGVPISFLNTSCQIQAPGQDGASLWANNLSLSSFQGIGFASNIANQTIPAGLYAAWIFARLGHISAMGHIQAFDATNNSVHTFGNVSIRRSGTDAQLYIDANSFVPSLTSSTPVAGGTGVNVNDRFYDAYFNIYTATATDGNGAATTIRMDTNTARIGGPPANPISLTAAPGFAGAGVTVNLTWTAPSRFLIANNLGGGSGVLALQAGGGALIQSLSAHNFQAGATFGNLVGSSTSDLTKHIALYASTYGFSVTSGRLNIVAPTSVFVGGGVDMLAIGASSIIAYQPITLPADPTAALQAATKQYVDNKVAGAGVSSFNTRIGAVTLQSTDISGASGLLTTGGTMTGPLTVNAILTAQTLVSQPASGAAALFLAQPAAANGCYIEIFTGGTAAANLRWLLGGTAAAESGSNVGTDFAIYRYSDTGVQLGTALYISRSTGGVYAQSGKLISQSGSNPGVTVYDTAQGVAYCMFLGSSKTLYFGGADATGAYVGPVLGSFDASGNFTATGSINTSSGNLQVFPSLDTGILVDANWVYFKFAGSWRWLWQRSSGTLMYTNGSGTTLLGISPNGYGISTNLSPGHYYAHVWNSTDYTAYYDGALCGNLLFSQFVSGTQYNSRQIARNVNGNCYLWDAGGQVSWTTSASDRRLKSNIAPTTFDALAAVNDLPVYSCSYKAPGDMSPVEQWDCALIAQEVRERIPHAVPKPMSDDEMLTLNPMHLCAVLWRAVQQLTARVATLEAA